MKKTPEQIVESVIKENELREGNYDFGVECFQKQFVFSSTNPLEENHKRTRDSLTRRKTKTFPGAK